MRQWAGHSLRPGQHVLLLVDGDSVNNVAEEIQQQLQGGKLVIIHQGKVSVAGIAPSSLDAVISFGSFSSHNDELLNTIMPLLKPGAFIALFEPLKDRSAEMSEQLSRRLLFSGFVDSKISQAGEHFEISASKPDWEVGSAQKINLRTGANKAAQTSAWASVSEHDNDIIDEDSLITDSDRTSKPSTKADDCEVGSSGKKACKNCTCGRADAEASGDAPKPKLTKEMIENPGVNSSCGSCGLGDAFRCKGCPYRGLPAFKVGEKITIPDGFMDDDLL